MNVNPDQPESNFPNMSNLVSEVPQQPKYSPDGNVVDAGKATSWYGYGFDQFKANAGVWIGMVVVLFVITLVLNVIPGIGTFVSNLLMPAFFGGLMLACQAHRESKPVTFEFLFAGFKDKFGALALLGLFWMIGVLVVSMVAGFFAVAVFGGAIATGAVLGSAGMMGLGFSALIGFVLLAMLIAIPLAMAIWFAPALVVFHNVAPIDALILSLKVSLKNWAAFLLFFVLYIVFAILASIPLALGWLVLGPVLVGAIYAAYRDIFLS
ncbi:hypothetical protein H8K52_18980 [Undibacterium seohonense]|uniref:Transmembrane protein n=1 Tax=Undibacterium seohonense TaxID=1344950 RepID=A0ABR6X9C9_9BURK|nr:BPSS1780 family membrane protein [Undibacterium seohonense]MBC3809430.1 hypothetical protein [Undibacterium seohonense]